ncbi:MAG: hypothetical protein Ct9H90mP30_1050 [Actinomycetota bacterium]|nr:MAG: hypothetical protein Ct9H90mP30_1050 [Actinomycetota bacterium]
MRTQFRTLKFSPATVGPVIDLMDRYRYTSDSIFWFNIEPDVDQRSVHTGSIFLGKRFQVVAQEFLSSHGPLLLIEKVIFSLQKSDLHTLQG